VASRRVQERRAQFEQYKRDVKERGKPFFPYAMFHDTVMSLVVVAVIIGLAVVWKFTTGPEPGCEGHSCLLGPRYTEEADPATTNFVPRPDWYFYFLFYLLRIFKWPDSVILGTVGIPTICLILLLMLPFIDVRRERRLLRRPVAVVASVLVVLSMGVLTYKGATARESLGSEVLAAVPNWADQQGFAGNQQAVRGAEIFAQVGCVQCHTYLGTGSANLGAPDLTSEGTKGRGLRWQVDHLECPSCVVPGSPMPPFASLGDDNLRRVAIFLEASKGPKK
jgi:menaquinol-cytochrome c reductase cytochrome b/c subunit